MFGRGLRRLVSWTSRAVAADGQVAGEPGLEGWAIFLDSDADGALDAGETSNTTDAEGNYEFVNVPPGTYEIAEVQQVAWTRTDCSDSPRHPRPVRRYRLVRLVATARTSVRPCWRFARTRSARRRSTRRRRQTELPQLPIQNCHIPISLT
jgi:hypothetical protein